ncbi:MAG: hypothetical protein HC767_12095 [Akkermansiaceae bacterium]|nr:hypothetical protein [Akkermansiaceae bacterium]
MGDRFGVGRVAVGGAKMSQIVVMLLSFDWPAKVTLEDVTVDGVCQPRVVESHDAVW